MTNFPFGYFFNDLLFFLLPVRQRAGDLKPYHRKVVQRKGHNSYLLVSILVAFLLTIVLLMLIVLVYSVEM